VLVVAPRVWHGVVVAARWLARETGSAAIRVWERARPMLRRGWAAFLAGSARAAHDLVAVVRVARARLSAYVDSRTGPEPDEPPRPRSVRPWR
jgi:hypothetical protein